MRRHADLVGINILPYTGACQQGETVSSVQTWREKSCGSRHRRCARAAGWAGRLPQSGRPGTPINPFREALKAVFEAPRALLAPRMARRQLTAALLLLAACAAQDSGPRYADIEPERWPVRVGVPSFGEARHRRRRRCRRAPLAMPQMQALLLAGCRLQSARTAWFRCTPGLQIHTHSGITAPAAGRGQASQRATTHDGRQSGQTCPTAATGAPAAGCLAAVAEDAVSQAVLLPSSCHTMRYVLATLPSLLLLLLPRRTGFMLPMIEWVCERAYLDCELVFQDTIPGMLQALVDVSGLGAELEWCGRRCTERMLGGNNPCLPARFPLPAARRVTQPQVHLCGSSDGLGINLSRSFAAVLTACSS